MTKIYKNHSPTTYIVLCGLFTALTAICSFITIPLPFTPVPLNFATLGVFLTGGLLGRKYGCISIAVYILLGTAGVPVFAGFRGGLAVLAGPTGGFIAGYFLAVFIIGILADNIHFNGMQKVRGIVLCALCMAAGLAACYAAGTLWFICSTGATFTAALVSCVLPFIAGDIIKICLASVLVIKLRNAV